MYCIIDVETTGGSKDYSKITEIAIFRHDGSKIVDEFVSLVNPECFIPEYISRLTGITNEMVEAAPKFFEIARRVIEITEGAVFVAHNVGFDYGMVQAEFASLGYDFKRETQCTVKLARRLLPGHGSYSLGNICDDLNIHIKGRHRAGGDALATVKLFEIIIEKNGGLVFDNPAEKKVKFKSLHPHIQKEKFESLPQSTGVYYLKNEKDEIVYVGKSKNLKSRVYHHLKGEGTRKASSMKYEVTDVDYDITGSELIALLKESAEIKAIQPKFNRAQRKKQNGYGLFLYFDRKGYNKFIIKKNDSVDTPVALFSNAEQARQQLYKWVDEYELCQKMSGLYEGNNGCFQYQLNQCHGACVGEEDSKQYNVRVEKLVQSLELGSKSMIIIDKGRSADELSVVYVEKGSYKGFGYFDREMVFNDPSGFYDVIEQREDTRDCRLLIASYLKKNKPLKVISF